jgi:hypothetical protein
VATDPSGLVVSEFPTKKDPGFKKRVEDAIEAAIKKGTHNGKPDAVARMLIDMKTDKTKHYQVTERNQDPQHGHCAAVGNGNGDPGLMTPKIYQICIPGGDSKIEIGSKEAGNLQTIDAPFEVSMIHEFGHADGKTGGFGYADPGGVPYGFGVRGALATSDDNVGAIDNVGRADYGAPLRPCY